MCNYRVALQLKRSERKGKEMRRVKTKIKIQNIVKINKNKGQI